jgi:hypothetical protein
MDSATAASASVCQSSAEKPASVQSCRQTALLPTAPKCVLDEEHASAISASAKLQLSENSARARRATKASTRFASFMSHVFSVLSTESWGESAPTTKTNAHRRVALCINQSFTTISRVGWRFLLASKHEPNVTLSVTQQMPTSSAYHV